MGQSKVCAWVKSASAPTAGAFLGYRAQFNKNRHSVVQVRPKFARIELPDLMKHKENPAWFEWSGMLKMLNCNMTNLEKRTVKLLRRYCGLGVDEAKLIANTEWKAINEAY